MPIARAFLLALVLLAGARLTAAAGPAARYAGADDQLTPLALAVVAPPVPFRGSDGLTHLTYELQVMNARPRRVGLLSLEVLDAADGRVLLRVGGADVIRTFELVDHTPVDGLGPSQVGWFWLDVPLPSGAATPKALAHRILTLGPDAPPVGPAPADPAWTQASQTGGAVTVSAKAPVVIGPPLEGKGWVAVNGCCAGQAHRRAGLPINSSVFVSQRFAIDWVVVNAEGRVFVGDLTRNESYPSYGRRALAVADAAVVSVLDGLPEREAGALPDDTSLQNITGNHVILDLGGGRYAFYAHLQPGSLRVRVGDRVKRGQVLARVGNSGNTTAPHLHFHVSDGIGPLSSQGVPYVIDRFTVVGRATETPDPERLAVAPVAGPAVRRHELPLANLIVDFPEGK